MGLGDGKQPVRYGSAAWQAAAVQKLAVDGDSGNDKRPVGGYTGRVADFLEPDVDTELLGNFPDKAESLAAGSAVEAKDFDMDRHFRLITPDSWVPGARVLNTVPYFCTFSCNSSRRRSDSSLSTRIS